MFIEKEKQAFLEGFVAGLKEFAWWKDGVQYVGTCGTTLKEAIRKANIDYETRNMVQ
jgi:hypothetical protein